MYKNISANVVADDHTSIFPSKRHFERVFENVFLIAQATVESTVLSEISMMKLAL